MLKIGWASRDVSTNAPVGIIGQRYERISTGSHDPTTVTALVMEDGKDVVFFVSGDFTSFSDGILNEVRAAVKEKEPAIEAGKIILNATHTHTAPRYHYTSWYDKAPKDRVNIEDPQIYRAFLVENIADAVVEAYQKRAEGSFSYGYSEAPIGYQRRAVFFNDKGANNNFENTFSVNGHGVMYGQTYQDDFSGYEGCLENNVNLLYTFDKEGRLTGAIINVSCPSQCTEHETFTSADYWNEVRAMIREKHGDIFILPQCAAAGDLSPHLLHGKEAFLRKSRMKYGEPEELKVFFQWERYYMRLAIAEKLARAFDECLEWAAEEKITEAPVVHVVKKVPLEIWKITEEEYTKAKENYEELLKVPFAETDNPKEDFKENTAISSNLSRYENVISRYERRIEVDRAEIHVLKIGEVAFTTCPFELFLDYQHRVQARSPFEQTLMVQLAADENDSDGYLTTEKGAANKGYSAIAFSCDISPAGGQTLVEEMVATLNEIK